MMKKNDKSIDRSMYDAPYFPKLKSPRQIYLDELPFRIEQFFRTLRYSIFDAFMANYIMEFLGIYFIEVFFVSMVLFLIIVSFFKRTTEHLQGYLFIVSLCTFFLIIDRIFFQEQKGMEIEDVFDRDATRTFDYVLKLYLDQPFDLLLHGLRNYIYFNLKGYDLASGVHSQPYVYLDYKKLTESFDDKYSYKRKLLDANIFTYLDERELYLENSFFKYGGVWSWMRENRSFSFFFFS